MDGVLVDFIKQINTYGFWRKNKDNKVDWDKVIAEGPEFWNQMDWFSDAEKAFSEFQKMAVDGLFNLYILSSIDFPEGVEGKKLWIKTHTSFPLENVIFVNNPEDKSQYAASDSFLLDDREKALEPFFNAGGNSIFFDNWNSSISQIKKLLHNPINISLYEAFKESKIKNDELDNKLKDCKINTVERFLSMLTFMNSHQITKYLNIDYPSSALHDFVIFCNLIKIPDMTFELASILTIMNLGCYYLFLDYTPDEIVKKIEDYSHNEKINQKKTSCELIKQIQKNANRNDFIDLYIPVGN